MDAGVASSDWFWRVLVHTHFSGDKRHPCHPSPLPVANTTKYTGGIAQRQGTGFFYCPPAVRAPALSSVRAGEVAEGDEVADLAGWRPSRTSDKTTASAQMTTDTRKAWTMPLVKSAEMLAARWPTVPRKT